MSVYIKGMEMPKTGEYRCVIRKWGEEITIDLYGDEELCGTLAPVPDHGRLIDAGDIYDKLDSILTQILGYRDGEDARSQSFQSGAYHLYQKVIGVLSNAPTIIPADKEDA